MIRLFFASGRILAPPLLFLLLISAGCSPTAPDPRQEEDGEVIVFAAASLRDVLTVIGLGFAARGGSTSFNFAGSNVLAQQIEAAPAAADVYLSAHESWIDQLGEAGLIEASSRRVLLSNRLVVIAHRDAPHTLDRLENLAALSFERLALGDPRAVPAGIYAREALEKAGVWEQLAGRLVPAPDARAARGLVETDPATLGIVYLTDARTSGVQVLLGIPPEQQPEIRYVAASTAASSRPAAALRFLDFLETAEARAIFIRHGFEIPAAGDGYGDG